MRIRAVVEFNEKGYLAYAENLPSAFARGRTKEEALGKLPSEAERYLLWSEGEKYAEGWDIQVIQDEKSEAAVDQADSSIIFDSEKAPLTWPEYLQLRTLAIKSARDFQALYDSIPDPYQTSLPPRECFYGPVPRTAREMYLHTNVVTSSYLDGLAEMENLPGIVENRLLAFKRIEETGGYLENRVYTHHYGEPWSLKKALRRFIWHDRIHAKAMYRMASGIWGDAIADPFHFSE